MAADLHAQELTVTCIVMTFGAFTHDYLKTQSHKKDDTKSPQDAHRRAVDLQFPGTHVLEAAEAEAPLTTENCPALLSCLCLRWLLSWPVSSF